MRKWFRIEFQDGTNMWVYSKRGWAGLIPYVAKLSSEPRSNNATVCNATAFESIVCYIANFFGASNFVEV